jgi:hypothetical protein
MNWLSEHAMKMKIPFLKLKEKIQEKRILLSKEAIAYYVENEDYESAKSYNLFLEKLGGESALYTIELDECQSLIKGADQLRVFTSYLKSIEEYNKALVLQKEHNFKELGYQVIIDKRQLVAKEYALDYYEEKRIEFDDQLSDLEENKSTLLNWISQYKIAKYEEEIAFLLANYEKDIGNAVTNYAAKFKTKLDNFVVGKDYVAAFELLENKNEQTFLDEYDDRYEMDFSDIYSQKTTIKTYATFLQESDEAFKRIKGATEEEIVVLFRLQKRFKNEEVLNENLNKPAYVPLYQYAKTLINGQVIFHTAKVYSRNEEYKKSFDLLSLALEKKAITKKTKTLNKQNKELQRKLAEKLAIADKAEGTYLSSEGGLASYGIIQDLEKPLKIFRKTYAKICKK